MPLMQLIIRILILMILFVIIYLISAILYSAKYWPDIYNYINANITIKRIPKISELNITEIEVFTTDPIDIYTTTEPEFEIEISTIDIFDINEFTNFERDVRDKRDTPIINFGNDYSELPKTEIVVDHMDWIDVKIEFNNKSIQTSQDDAQKFITYSDSNDNISNIQPGNSIVELMTNDNNTTFYKNYNQHKSNQRIDNQDNKDFDRIAMYVNRKTDDNVSNINNKNKVISNLMDNNENDIKNAIDVIDNVQIDKSNQDLDYSNEGSTIDDLIDDSKLTTRILDVEMVTGNYRLINRIVSI